MVSCASLPSAPPFPYTDLVRVRREFLGGETVGLSYDPVMWDGMIEGKGAAGRHGFGPNRKTGKYELAFYVRVKNLNNTPFRVAPSQFALITVSGQTFAPGPATASTSQPLPITELHAQGQAEGYIVFELPPDALARDQPSRLHYDDGTGRQASRYLFIPDMLQYEGLSPVVSGEAARPPPLPRERQPQRRLISNRWETRWAPGQWYEGVWYPGRYATFWIEGWRE